MKDPVYLDYNATTPLDPFVAAAMRPYLEGGFGNPSSSHRYGVEARRAVEEARARVASLIGAKPEDIVFTSGGSEANNFAIKGAAFSRRDRGQHLIASAVEHPAVLEVLRWLETQGFRTSLLPVDRHGLVDPAELEKAIAPDTILVSVMHANNEVGTVEPIAELAAIARRAGILFHCDAAQSVGKIPVDVGELGVDFLSIAGHKLYAPKGIGALYMRPGLRLEKFVHGAGHERGLRAGTENVLGIVGLGAAAELATRELDNRSRHARELRDLLWDRLRTGVPNLVLNGHPERRLPNTLSVAFPGLEADTLLSELENVAASAGAACHAESVEISSVLTAMGLPVELAMGTVRFSTGAFLTAAEVEEAAREVVAAAGRLVSVDTSGDEVEADPAEGETRLTRYTHGLGCACKLPPRALEAALRSLPPVSDPAALVGIETSDDAAVYALGGSGAIVQTLDFFTPIVDDPWHFGAIAAANALSDIYAMGGKPLFALGIVCFPMKRLPLPVLGRILEGAAAKAAEAGISIIGGHSVDDAEPKFGLAVTGRVDPGRIYRNSGARPGDLLVLTKPLGIGIATTAMKRGMAPTELSSQVIALMERLNAAAAALLPGFDVGGVTDVTGFGFLGHLREMSRGALVDMEVSARAVPVIEGVPSLAAAGMVPGGSKDNAAFVADLVAYDEAVPELSRAILSDAQTSGGLLISVAEKDGAALVDALREIGSPEAAVVGRCLGPGEGRIFVRA